MREHRRLGDCYAGEVGRLEVVDADLQLHRTSDLPERLQPDQRCDLDWGFLDGTWLPTATGPDLRQRLCPDLAADLDGQLVERADVRPEHSRADVPGRLHGDDRADLYRWYLGGPGLLAELAATDMSGWDDPDRGRDLEQHDEQLEPAELHAGDAAARTDVLGRVHDADGTCVGRNLLVLADLRAASGAAGSDLRQRLHANDRADLEWQFLGWASLYACLPPAASDLRRRLHPDGCPDMEWLCLGRSGLRAQRSDAATRADVPGW
ncbi:MAG: hypothetical protein E6Q67_02805 [Roseateles sp.]|nr:MAG: hypothetical protein E6Q67_02805 [Roseateles sp.]